MIGLVSGSHKLKAIFGRRFYDIIAGLLTIVGIGYVTHWSVELFGLRFDKKNLAIESEVRFTKMEYDMALGWTTKTLMTLGGVAFMAEIAAAVIR